MARRQAQLTRYGRRWISVVASMMLLIGCSRPTRDARVLRVGYFPNITHAQALIGLANGTFQRALGPDVTIKTFVMNAGPAAIEALFAGELDLTYIGPGPAINGYVKSDGQALRIVSGAASGGAVLVVRQESDIHVVADFAGKRVASPQLGNTQDIALRYYLTQHDLAATEQGGTVWVTPMQNADILTGFLRHEVDAAWVPEPWGARLVHEAQGRIFLDERELWPGGMFPTAVIVVSTKALHDRPELIARWLTAHVQLTRWIQQYPQEAQQQVNVEISKLTGKALPEPLLREAWSRLIFTYDLMAPLLVVSADHAFAAGFLGRQKPDLTDLVSSTLLDQVLQQQPTPTE